MKNQLSNRLTPQQKAEMRVKVMNIVNAKAKEKKDAEMVSKIVEPVTKSKPKKK